MAKKIQTIEKALTQVGVPLPATNAPNQQPVGQLEAPSQRPPAAHREEAGRRPAQEAGRQAAAQEAAHREEAGRQAAAAQEAKAAQESRQRQGTKRTKEPIVPPDWPKSIQSEIRKLRGAAPVLPSNADELSMKEIGDLFPKKVKVTFEDGQKFGDICGDRTRVRENLPFPDWRLLTIWRKNKVDVMDFYVHPPEAGIHLRSAKEMQRWFEYGKRRREEDEAQASKRARTEV